MPTTFYRLNTDQTRISVPLEDLHAGPTLSACWLVGGGPSLTRLPCKAIGESPIPKMCLNLAGSRLLRPTFWTSYDPSARFHRSIYLDPGVMKFVHRRRAMDLVPETTFKVCDCPNTFFFDRDGQRGFADFLSAQAKEIVDWADTMVQAIDILYRLGFRIVYLAGCEMRVRPSEEQIELAKAAGVAYSSNELLRDFLQRCADAGVSAEDLDSLPPGSHYHFGEHKPIQAAANTDWHYFRIAQYLRLSRRSLSLAGVQIVSVTPHSRLNDYFPYMPARRVLRRIALDVGDPKAEPVRGLYSQSEPRQSRPFGPMRDYRPHHWPPDKHLGPQPTKRNGSPPPNPAAAIDDGEILVEAEGLQRCPVRDERDDFQPHRRLEAKLKRIPDGFFAPCEEG